MVVPVVRLMCFLVVPAALAPFALRALALLVVPEALAPFALRALALLVGLRRCAG